MGDRIAADGLLRLGVVTEVVDDDQVLARSQALASEMASWPAQGVSAIKPAIRTARLGMSPEQWFASFASQSPTPPRPSTLRSPA